MKCRRYRRQALSGTVALLLAMSGSASAQREAADLKSVPPGQQVASLRYCRSTYRVTLKDGSVRSFKEYDLGFKTDSGPRGPETTTPVLVPTGRVGDRAFVVFAGLDELKAALEKEC